MLENPVKSDIFRVANSRPDVRLFRNNVGLGWCGKLIRKTIDTVTIKFPRAVKFGLHVGSGDLIGWKSITVTPEMVGLRLAIFLSVETKSSTGRLKPEQINWHEQVIKSGGISGMARSAEDFFDIIGENKL